MTTEIAWGVAQGPGATTEARSNNNATTTKKMKDKSAKHMIEQHSKNLQGC